MIENLVSLLNLIFQNVIFTLPKEHISVTVVVVVVCDEDDGSAGGSRVPPELIPFVHRHVNHHTTNTQLSEEEMCE